MTVEQAKEFLVDLADNDGEASKVDAAYLSALRAAASNLGYSVSDEDIANALVEMTGLGDDEDPEVAGFGFNSVAFHPDSISNLGAFSVFASFRTYQPRRFGR